MKRYPAEVRAAAVDLAGSVGVYAAARLLGLPGPTVYRWTHPEYDERQRALGRAYKERHRGSCSECGGPTTWALSTGAKPLRCQPCAARFRSENRVWTREAIVEAIRFYAAKYGRPPGAQDWNPPMARSNFRDDISERFYEDGCWPHAPLVQREFGSWNAAIRAAGFTPLAPGHKYVDLEPHGGV